MFTRFFDLEGKEKFNHLSERVKRTKTIVPDLVSSHHPADTAIFTSGPQMWKIKRVHALLSFYTSGLSVGLNEYYRLRHTGRFVPAGPSCSHYGSRVTIRYPRVQRT